MPARSSSPVSSSDTSPRDREMVAIGVAVEVPAPRAVCAETFPVLAELLVVARVLQPGAVAVGLEVDRQAQAVQAVGNAGVVLRIQRCLLGRSPGLAGAHRVTLLVGKRDELRHQWQKPVLLIR